MEIGWRYIFTKSLKMYKIDSTYWYERNNSGSIDGTLFEMDRRTVFCSGEQCSISESKAFSTSDLSSICDLSITFINNVSIMLLMWSSLQTLIPSTLFIDTTINWYDNLFVGEKCSNCALKTFTAFAASSLKNVNENRHEFIMLVSIIENWMNSVVSSEKREGTERITNRERKRVKSVFCSSARWILDNQRKEDLYWVS